MTTTIRLEGALKKRVAAVAKSAGKTTHAFMLDAIADTVTRAEQDEELQSIADARWADIAATGKTVPWDRAKAYLMAKVRGQHPRRPRARKLRR